MSYESTKTATTPGITLGGDRAQELAAIAMQNSAYKPAAPVNPPSGFSQWASSQTPVDSASTEQENIYATLLNRLRNNQATNKVAFPDYVGPTMSPAQRAALAVGGKYTAQQQLLERSSQKNDQNLQVGVATQNNYGAIGDAKLKDIYSGLTDIANQTADKTKNLYAAAQSGVEGAYNSAQATQDAAANTTQTDVASTAGQLGLQAAVADATKNLTNYQDAAKSQLAASKAAGVANIITLGANMGAAALKDVNIMAQLGADSRRDLVNSVQNTIATLQFQHDQLSADLQAQMQANETERQSALQAATYQYEADDAQKQFEYMQSKAQFEAKQQQNEIENNRNNLLDMLAIMKQQNDDLSTSATIDATRSASQLAERKLNFEMNQQDIVNQLDRDKFKLESDKTYASIQDAKDDNALAAIKAADDNAYKTKMASIAADNSLTASQKAAAQTAETARHNKVSEQLTAQGLVIKQQQADASTSLATSKSSQAAQATQNNNQLTAARIAQMSANTKLAEAKAAALGSTTKFNGGIEGINQAVTAGKVSKDAGNAATALIAAATSDPTVSALNNDPYTAAQAKFYSLSDVDPANLTPIQQETLTALAIYYKKR